MATKVKNVKAENHKIPQGYSTWLEFWEKKSGQKATECHAIDCHAKINLVGAFVKKVDTEDDRIYIVPLCTVCIKREKEFFVDEPLILAK